MVNKKNHKSDNDPERLRKPLVQPMYQVDYPLWLYYGGHQITGIPNIDGSEQVSFYRTISKDTPQEHTGYYVKIGLIKETAGTAGVIPELLIDENYYSTRYGTAPYRLALAIMKKYPTFEDFYQDCTSSMRYKPTRMHFRFLLRGTPLKIAERVDLWFREVCAKIDFPVQFYHTPVRHVATLPTTLALGATFAGLPPQDLIFLAGIAKVLHDDKDLPPEKLNFLLEWRKNPHGKTSSATRTAQNQ